MASLYDECIDALENSVFIYNEEDSRALKAKMFEIFKFEAERIDWNYYNSYVEIDDINNILNLLLETNCLIIWDEFDMPVIKSNLNSVINNIDDVTAVAFDTWIIGQDFEWIIEFYHEGEIRVLKR